ncbi:hypothetical protein EMIHUDRAFT_242189 [Emiliania huxleyi CCMP1516]|uniref:Uncharacterized protein n=2 Tax=Emiliania huxleyi TaxID=2903 RepID=A0A0D3J9W6_EMIH1|nr:hypothetical protein EMIHUDRAFT_242189 [Emiliania huxleyi CCMP1516]EOD20301.1 hypothetical protein EMIHUDRAFT_242189 [Emiliania huxleyi CCMP1516]|eukprot:XP_005772730.1 hypothetical protein EMIHUDRAFT_242189 [Emiliania huxleyi CCMP1516]
MLGFLSATDNDIDRSWRLCMIVPAALHELAKMMMSRKKRRLYDRMQHGIQKKAVAADALRAKRASLEAAAASAKPPSGKAKGGGKSARRKA